MLFNKLIVKSVNGHYEAFLDNVFICSGDSYQECYNDALDMINK